MKTLLNYIIHQPTSPASSTPIILIHGLFGDLNNLGVLARDLKNHYITLQVDVRNHGDSFRSESMNYAEMAQDIIDLVTGLGYSKVILIGHSMGGKIAMAASAIKPELIENIVVIDMAPVAYQQHRHQHIFSALQAVLDNNATSRQTAAVIMREYLSEEGVIQFLLKSFRQGEWKFNLPVLIQQYDNIIGWQQLPSWSGKILFIPGGNSSYVKPEYRDIIAEQFPNASAWVVAGADHWVHAEKPETVLRAIHRFLAA
ncbi:alpha/beta fold hydrolase [Moellerella wisconsensis]|uniref:Alpha/beta fold hydrolase n=1 Tax=Moellerella wisconsensis TaxID=158849 RepID=A0ACD3Y9E5_9GAMM|nr:alpha/beta fold hydrolase [Moellerella wisconsensis]UNH39748.1 alpha/beta fold hydrolase [Moellerella wisconsensis]